MEVMCGKSRVLAMESAVKLKAELNDEEIINYINGYVRQ